MQSSPAEESAQCKNRKRSPAWTDREVQDLIAVWGEESVLSELRSNKRNAKTFEKVSQAMTQKGYSRDAMQCRVKVKDLRQGYQKVRAANGRSGAQPQTCRFYEALHAILGGSATTVPPVTVDSVDGIVSQDSSYSMFADGQDDEGSVEEGAGDSEHNAAFPDSQDLFLTLTEIPYQPSPAVNPDSESGEGSGASDPSRTAPASPSQRLAMIRRRKKKTRDEMFAELMACSRAEAAEQKHWRETLCEQHRTLMEREDRWRQEDQQTTQTLLGLMKEQTDTLRRLVDVLQDRRLEDRVPLQCICNRPPPPRSPGPPLPKSTDGGAVGAVRTVTEPEQSDRVPRTSHVRNL